MRVIYYILIVCSTFILFNCSNTRHLKPGEYLLSRNSIQGNKKVSREEFVALYRQKPNRKILGHTPYLSAYYLGKSRFDTSEINREITQLNAKYNSLIDSEQNEKKRNKLIEKRDNKLEDLYTKLKEGNWMMRAVGEPPAIYDSAFTHETVRQMQFYLFSKGFFEGSVNADVDTSGKKVTVKYHVNEGDVYTIKEINYQIKDSLVNSIIQGIRDNSLIKAGEPYVEANLTAERDRINNELKDNGYYDFTRQYIFFDIDTTQDKRAMIVTVLIENPPDQNKHKRYSINKIFFNTDVISENVKRDTALYRGVHYVFHDKRFSKKILSTKIKLSPGMNYNETLIQKTQRQLADLDIYKFINVNFEKNAKDSSGNSLTAYINASPLKRYQITDEVGLTVAQGWVPGPFGSVTFKERNIFHGFESFEIGIRASIAGQASLVDPTDVLNNEEYGINSTLTFPQLFFPTKIRHKLIDYDPKTRILAGYNIVRRPEYTRQIVKGALTYTITPNKNSQYNLSIIDINLINTPPHLISDTFRSVLESLQNPTLTRNFGQSLNTDINGWYVYNNNEIGSNKKSKYIRLYLESGGTTLNLFNKTPLFEKNDSLFGLATFRYIKINPDFRKYYPTGRTSTFAMRVAFGYAYAYGIDRAMPYEKYFFSGGSNSIRAWQPRRLGPGSFAQRDPVTGEVNYRNRRRFEQFGDMLFETNYEYRFKIIDFLNGAFFVDAGNIWTLRPDPNRPGSEFKFDKFLSQIAIGTGFGIRLDFSFLILRFDLGIKAYDPAQINRSKLILFNQGIKTSVINIGIGYPF